MNDKVDSGDPQQETPAPQPQQPVVQSSVQPNSQSGSNGLTDEQIERFFTDPRVKSRLENDAKRNANRVTNRVEKQQKKLAVEVATLMAANRDLKPEDAVRQARLNYLADNMDEEDDSDGAASGQRSEPIESGLVGSEAERQASSMLPDNLTPEVREKVLSKVRGKAFLGVSDLGKLVTTELLSAGKPQAPLGGIVIENGGAPPANAGSQEDLKRKYDEEVDALKGSGDLNKFEEVKKKYRKLGLKGI